MRISSEACKEHAKLRLHLDYFWQLGQKNVERCP